LVVLKHFKNKKTVDWNANDAELIKQAQSPTSIFDKHVLEYGVYT